MENMSFRKVIAAGTEQTIKERIKDDGHVIGINVRFYPGVQKSLQVHPFVRHKLNHDEDLFSYVAGTDTFLTGDDDTLKFEVNLAVEVDDEFCVYVKNTDGQYDYSLSVDVLIRYDGAGLL